MSNIAHFRRPRLAALDLEIVKVQCWRSWFSSQVIPTELVEALVEEVELLHTEMAKLHEKLAQTKLDAEIYEGMYDTKRAECDELLVKLEQAYAVLTKL